MKLSLKNFGKIEKASVEIHGITVIAADPCIRVSDAGWLCG